MTMLRSRLKTVLYRSRLFDALHWIRNRNTLTVVMFHRVLPPSSPQYAQANPVWTVSSSLFGECLEFFSKKYNVISLEDLRQARRRNSLLPKRALLITFDDGWEDNADHALAWLRSAGLPAALFVVASLVRPENAKSFSQDPKDSDACVDASTSLTSGSADDEQLARHMLSAEQLNTLHSNRVSIESHGLTHAPVTLLRDRTRQLRCAQSRLSRILSLPDAPLALSFPHGKYDSASVHDALAAGHDLLFTSDCCLNEAGSEVPSGIFGRIYIPGAEISSGTGHLRPELLATWLFFRPRRTLRVS